MSRASRDLDLMLLGDGELEGAEASEVARELETSDDARAVATSLRQVGETVRTYLELETDRIADTAPAFGRMWDNIDRAIHANGAAERVEAPVRAVDEVEAPAKHEPGLLERLRDWFHTGWQSHALTGAVAAAGVALFMWMTGPSEQVVERTTIRESGPVAMPASALASQPPEVENLEVYEGSGTILTIPGEDPDDSSTAVIWISPDSDVEGPI